MLNLLLSFCLLASAGTAEASVIPTNDGDPIPIIIDDDQGPFGNRSPLTIPISGYVDTNMNIVFISFSYPCGMVSIFFSNLSTGDYFNTNVNGTGTAIIPVELSSGFWKITFTLSDGAVYIGNFTI